MRYCTNCGAEESDPCKCGYPKPFTPQEKEIWDLLVAAHGKFIEMYKMDGSREKAGFAFTPSQEWTSYMNHLQDLLIFRIVKRDYPNEF